MQRWSKDYKAFKVGCQCFDIIVHIQHVTMHGGQFRQGMVHDTCNYGTISLNQVPVLNYLYIVSHTVNLSSTCYNSV